MLEVKNLSYQVNNFHLIRDVNFCVQPGKLVGIIGANGAGKSTLIKLLSLELIPKRGKIEWRQKCVNEYSPKDLAKERGVFRQTTAGTNHFNVSEVVSMGRYPHSSGNYNLNDRLIIEDEMEFAGLGELGVKLYDRLSGGEQQRVNLSRTFVQVKSVSSYQVTKCLLLDEPLNHLDIKYIHEVLSRIGNFVQLGNIALVVMHDIQKAANYCDEVIVLKNGSIYAKGTPKEVYSSRMLEDCFDVKAKVFEMDNDIVIRMRTR